MLASESLSIGGRRVAGFGLHANPNTYKVQLAPCATVTFQAAGAGNPGTPLLDPAYWQIVSAVVNGGIADMVATYTGPPQDMPPSFPDTKNGSGSPWTVGTYSIALPTDRVWNGSACVLRLQLPGPPQGSAQPAPVNSKGPAPVKAPAPAAAASSSSSTWYYVAGAAALAVVGWALLK